MTARTVLPPLILKAASGRHAYQCRHGACDEYRCGFPTESKAVESANTHMLMKHGVKR